MKFETENGAQEVSQPAGCEAEVLRNFRCGQVAG